MSPPILTDRAGAPLPDRPAQPPPDAPVADHIAWQRAVAAWRDDVASMAGAAFAHGFARAMRGRR